MRGVAECQEALFEIEVVASRLGAGRKNSEGGTRSHYMYIEDRDLIAGSPIPDNPRCRLWADARQLAKRVTKGNITKTIEIHFGQGFQGIGQVTSPLRGKPISNGPTADSQGFAKKPLKLNSVGFSLRPCPQKTTYPSGSRETNLGRCPMSSQQTVDDFLFQRLTELVAHRVTGLGHPRLTDPESRR